MPEDVALNVTQPPVQILSLVKVLKLDTGGLHTITFKAIVLVSTHTPFDIKSVYITGLAADIGFATILAPFTGPCIAPAGDHV